MIWCFGFLWFQCDLDERLHQRREALQMLTLMTDTVQRPDNLPRGVSGWWVTKVAATALSSTALSRRVRAGAFV